MKGRCAAIAKHAFRQRKIMQRGVQRPICLFAETREWIFRLMRVFDVEGQQWKEWRGLVA
jgi:hypothetical protein